MAVQKDTKHVRKVQQLHIVSTIQASTFLCSIPQYSPGQASLVETILIPDMFCECVNCSGEGRRVTVEAGRSVREKGRRREAPSMRCMCGPFVCVWEVNAGYYRVGASYDSIRRRGTPNAERSESLEG